METSRSTRVLKRSPARTVRLETAPAGGSDPAPRVVKRFASEGLFAAARDHSRARRERELLAVLHARGLPVPRPIALERRDGGWEVVMEWIPASSPFSAVLEGGTAWPAAPGVLARALGRLLARLHACGVDHPDLHPGNALVDAGGRAWAIDFHKARRVEMLGAARLEEQLAHLAAGTRERSSRRFRARFLVSWWRALPAAMRPASADLPALAARAEALGRRERLVTVERRRLRWTRPGTAVRAVQLADGEGFERADREEGLARTIEAALERLGAPASRAMLPCSTGEGCRALVVRGTWRSVSAAWFAAARLEEHALPAARPLAVARATRAWAAFELPAHGHEPASLDELHGRRLLHGLGGLAGGLHDRGLRPPRLAPELLWIDERGRVQLTCVSRLSAAPAASPAEVLRPWSATLGADRAGRAALAAGFGAALDLPRAQRAVLHADLRRG